MPVAYTDTHAGEFREKTLDFFLWRVQFVALQLVFACRPCHSRGHAMIMSSLISITQKCNRI